MQNVSRSVRVFGNIRSAPNTLDVVSLPSPNNLSQKGQQTFTTSRYILDKYKFSLSSMKPPSSPGLPPHGFASDQKGGLFSLVSGIPGT